MDVGNGHNISEVNLSNLKAFSSRDLHVSDVLVRWQFRNQKSELPFCQVSQQQEVKHLFVIQFLGDELVE